MSDETMRLTTWKVIQEEERDRASLAAAPDRANQLPSCPRVQLVSMKESWTCPSEQCGIQNVVFAYERANGDQPSYANCRNCGVKVELGIPRRAEAAARNTGQVDWKRIKSLINKRLGAMTNCGLSKELYERLRDDIFENLDALAVSPAPVEDEKCANHCGHGMMYMKDGACSFVTVRKGYWTGGIEYRCGHRCNFSRPAHSPNCPNNKVHGHSDLPCSIDCDLRATTIPDAAPPLDADLQEAQRLYEVYELATRNAVNMDEVRLAFSEWAEAVYPLWPRLAAPNANIAQAVRLLERFEAVMDTGEVAEWWPSEGEADRLLSDVRDFFDVVRKGGVVAGNSEVWDEAICITDSFEVPHEEIQSNEEIHRNILIRKIVSALEAARNAALKGKAGG